MVGWAAYLVCALAASAGLTGTPPAFYGHPGTVVDAANGKGLEAEASAYASEATDAEGPCPKHNDELQSTRSNQKTGDFKFDIRVDRLSYVAVYCKAGYYYRTETANRNIQDRTRVAPDPIELLPSRTSKASDEQSLRVVAAAVERQIARFRSNLKYFARSDAMTVRAVMQKLPDDQREAVLVLGGDELRRTLEFQTPRPK